MIPTDGNGKFFWSVGNEPVINKASCPMYHNGNWSQNRPKYIIPTQPPRLFNKQVAEFYQNNDQYRGIAYYLDGYLCALLDGHHKAVAAAIERRTLKSPRFKEVAFFVGRNEGYVSIWSEVYTLISKIKDEEVEDFFVEFLVNDENLRSDITKIVDDYFRVAE